MADEVGSGFSSSSTASTIAAMIYSSSKVKERCVVLHRARPAHTLVDAVVGPFSALGEDALMADAGLRIKSILNFAFEAEPSLDADFQLESQLSLRHRRLKAVAFVTRTPSSLWEGDRASEWESVYESNVPVHDP